MTSMIADDMAAHFNVPVLQVASNAHTMALMNMCVFMLGIGMQLKSEEFAAADVTEADLDAAISQILGGSND